MQSRGRRSLIWAVPFLMALAGWAGTGGAFAADARGLDLTAPCAAADGLNVAELAAPDWAQEPAAPAMGTESAPPAMGTESPGMAGGPSCTTNKQCHDTKMFCAKANGHCKAKGECTAKPDVCPDVVAPVCGCNGKTYNNECMAHRAGVNVRAEGKCKSTHKTAKPKPAASAT